MTNDVAVFLDLDNLVIGAKQANLTFDIDLILSRVKELTNGRIVLRRSYGDYRQDRHLMEQLTTVGFTTQSTVKIHNLSKNLADMQIVVDTMDTLIDGHEYTTYVLMTGDRDFTPLVQSLHKRGKHVIGVGMKHTASKSFVSLCDHYLFYEDLIPSHEMTEVQVSELLEKALDVLITADTPRVRASVLKQQMNELSNKGFEKSQAGNGSFSKFLTRFPHQVEVIQDGTTTYVGRPQKQMIAPLTLHQQYRSSLKKQRLRLVSAQARFVIIRDLVVALLQRQSVQWRPFIDELAEKYQAEGKNISKNEINAVFLLAREAQIVQSHKGKSLANAQMTLLLKTEKPVPEAIIRCDAAYLQAILNLPEPFDIEEAALALYENPNQSRYLKVVMEKWVNRG